jgi:hypothetical protein
MFSLVLPVKFRESDVDYATRTFYQILSHSLIPQFESVYILATCSIFKNLQTNLLLKLLEEHSCSYKGKGKFLHVLKLSSRATKTYCIVEV